MTKHSKKIVGFLFGSGVSLPSKFPSTLELSQLIYSGNGISRWDTGHYYIGKPQYSHAGFSEEYVPGIVAFLNRIRVEIDKYFYQYPFKISTNYEDLYYICKQMEDSMLGEYENPAIQRLINKLNNEIKSDLIFSSGHDKIKNLTLREICSEAVSYIYDIVHLSLIKSPTSLDQFKFLKLAKKENSISNINIYTINHDTLVEDYLIQNNISYIDGFTKKNNYLRIWQPSSYLNTKTKIRIYKLHGSVNWYRFGSSGRLWDEEFYGIPKYLVNYLLTDENNKSILDNNNYIMAIELRPKLLVGTTNKLLDYTASIYADIFTYVNLSMQNLDFLIISGYGFGDRGINTLIIKWLYSSPNHRIILIHHNPLGLLKYSRGSIRNKWLDWKNNKRIVFITKKIQDVTWKEIMKKLYV